MPRMTASVLKVVAALLAAGGDERYGLQLMQATGLPSGTLYPILVRLQQAGWVESRWEQTDPAAEGRPARRYYLLTADGTAEARREVALMRQQMSPFLGEAPA
ncbi:helix-turn-helix transcriptional regulator [Actinoplanes sp. NBRC 103695]|uniref:PadR family transcriptional regulator n=1 Tax=Actinoplanes sp. NBRC 103695 TaxID=3032202 RepID=UPI0024A20528|nr:helix-turn-helix transcriptional regulator [Actinoplanes sp. NBRC 103695]GLY96761.1 PadR family transcriptional regulator [Actinoplanes sp. NBRC 103695]